MKKRTTRGERVNPMVAPPPRSQTGESNWLSGEAVLTAKRKGFTLRMKETGDEFDFDNDVLRDLGLKRLTISSRGLVAYANVQKDEETLSDLHPLSGPYVVKFKEFRKNRDGLAEPVFKDSTTRTDPKTRKPYSTRPAYFITGIFELVPHALNGDWAGSTAPAYMEYEVLEVDGKIRIPEGGKRTKLVLFGSFVTLSRLFDSQDWDWVDNPLLDWETYLQEQSSVLTVTIDRGWIVGFSNPPANVKVNRTIRR